MPVLIALLCAAFVVGTVVQAQSERAWEVNVISYFTAFAIGAWHMLRAQPLPVSQRRREVGLTVAAIGVLFLLTQALGHLR